MAKIDIDDNTLNLLKYRRVKKIAIYKEIPFGCWGIPKPDFFVKLSGPINPEDYHQYILNEMEIYISKDIETEDTVVIREAEYFSDLPDKEFEVQGVK